MNRKQLEKKIQEVESSLAFARHKQGDYFPHPHWEEDEKRLEKELTKLKTQLQEIKDGSK